MNIVEKNKDVVLEYVSSDILNEEEFCIKNNIDFDVFRAVCYLTSKNNIELYNRYVIKNQLSRIADGICNGVLENINGKETKRKFNGIDYYTITNVHPGDISKYVNFKLERSKMVKFKQFVADYSVNRLYLTSSRSVKEKTILDMEYNFHGRVISMEEKKAIISYINDIGAPLGHRIFRDALLMYLNGKYELSNGNKLILTK